MKGGLMTESVTLTVTGMKCSGCEANITGKLKSLDGVLMAVASRADKEVKVEFDAKKTTTDAIKAVIAQAGYTVQDF